MMTVVLILAIILLVPIGCRKIHVPGIVGLILAGMIFGPHGLNLIANSNVIDLLGKMGMLYIMFQSGSEIDLNDMKEYRTKALLYGLLTFMFPFLIGAFCGFYLLRCSLPCSILFGAIFGSHTLMTYPIVGRYGVQGQRSVNVVVSATMIAVALSLLTLALVTRETSSASEPLWVFACKVMVWLSLVVWLLPFLVRLFLKRWDDPTSGFILVMLCMVLSAELSVWAGLDAILGAFLCGVTLNRLLPNHSLLVSRINFMGNAIFIPVFLLSVGLMIDFRVFGTGTATLIIAGIMIAVKLVGKWLASFSVQRLWRWSALERQLMFGLTHAASAGTLAIVTIGYQIGIFSDAILNASILMILVLCTISSFVTEHAAKLLALHEKTEMDLDGKDDEWMVAGMDTSSPSALASLVSAAQLTNVETAFFSDWRTLNGNIEKNSKTVVVYREKQPLNTINRLLVAVPRYAEKERDFLTCFGLVRRLSSEIGAKVIFYASQDTQQALRLMCNRAGKTLPASFVEMDDWEDVLMTAKQMDKDDLLILLSSRHSTASYNPLFEQIPSMLTRFFTNYSWMVIYPEQQTGGVDMDAFLTDIPQASKTWSVVSWLLNRLRRFQHMH